MSILHSRILRFRCRHESHLDATFGADWVLLPEGLWQDAARSSIDLVTSADAAEFRDGSRDSVEGVGVSIPQAKLVEKLLKEWRRIVAGHVDASEHRVVLDELRMGCDTLLSEQGKSKAV